MDPKAPMEVAALGQPFGLGMLYDCRRDSLISGMTLWDCNNLIEHTRERPKHYSDFDVVASDSLEAKSSALNVKASLKASFLSGLVEVEGSAKYLTDQKTSKNQARVTLMYKTTTKFQEMSMNHLGKGNIQHHNVFEKGIATHVVTGILYGANAFFVFDREMTENEDHRDIQGNMKVMIKKIPSTTIEGDGSLKMEDKDKKTVEKFSCKFYGDFLLEKNPVTFQDAVEVYQRLPKLLGAKGENAVPVKVWLLPLTVIDSKAAELVREISASLVQKAQNVLEDLSEPEIRCNDAMKTTIAQQFPQIGEKLKRFKEICSMFKLEFQQTLAKKLPSIRGGGEEEEELAKILKNRYSTCFSSKDLRVWMDLKEREIYILEFFTSMMKNTKVIPSENHLYKEIIRTEYTVCFVFTSLGSAEPYLSALSSYLGGTTNPDASQAPCDHNSEMEQWYTSKEVTEEIRKQAKLFSDFAEANKDNENTKFLVVSFTDEAKRGSAIYLYNGVFTVSENFEPPSKPEAVIVSGLKHNSVTLKISPAKYGAENITSYLVEFCVCGEDEWKQQTVPTTDADEVTVRDLSPNTGYKLRCRAVTAAGVGPASDIKVLHASSLGEDLKHLSKIINSGSPKMYSLEKKDMGIQGCKKYTFGKEESTKNRTIVLLGASGSGKSTLINGMINYIVGVEWEDDFRFVLVDNVLMKSQAHSLTDEVTVYQLNHQEGFKIPFSLTIVDTPGFGDTKDIERDRQTTKQLHKLFSAYLCEIDAVCIVAQAASPELTTAQNYVFDLILSIFGKDISENIRVLVTFADDEHPPILKAIRDLGVPCLSADAVNFCFNNSGLFSSCTSDKDDGVDQMHWNMGTKNMERFFDELNGLDTKSLQNTLEVFSERQQFEELMQDKKNSTLMKKISEKLQKIELHPSPLYSVEHIDKLIGEEECEPRVTSR